MPRKVSEALKKTVAGKQSYKCANRPGSNLPGIEGYKCARWKLEGEIKGCFDESAYEIDHIVPYSISHDDREENLQALCARKNVQRTFFRSGKK
jgi:5-methylcytosine-specific restriction endonuclease McrA